MAKVYERYDGRLALITGASAGLGAAYARAYAELGADVVLVARREERLRDLAAEIERDHKVKAHVIAQDLSAIDAHERIVEQLSRFDGKPDILVNNAGFSIPSEFVDTDWKRQQDFVMTLVMAVTSLAHAFAPHMKEQGFGRILNISSIVAFSPGGVGHTLYPAAKAYVLRFSQSLNEELRDHGVNVTAICPGSTITEFKVASGMATEAQSSPSMFVETAEKVVEDSLKASARRKAVFVSGLHNKTGVSLLRVLPDWITVPLIRWGLKQNKAKYET